MNNGMRLNWKIKPIEGETGGFGMKYDDNSPVKKNIRYLSAPKITK